MRHGASPRPKSSPDIAATSDPSSSAAEAHRTRENRSGARPPSRAEIRTRDGGAHGNCAHQLSYRFTPSHIKTASSQLASQGAYSCLIHGALDVQTFGSKKSSKKSLSHALQQVAPDGTCSKRTQRSITVTGCLEKNKRVTSSLKPRCSSNKSSVDRSHSIVTPEQRTGSTRVN